MSSTPHTWLAGKIPTALCYSAYCLRNRQVQEPATFRAVPQVQNPLRLALPLLEEESCCLREHWLLLKPQCHCIDKGGGSHKSASGERRGACQVFRTMYGFCFCLLITVHSRFWSSTLVHCSRQEGVFRDNYKSHFLPPSYKKSPVFIKDHS